MLSSLRPTEPTSLVAVSESLRRASPRKAALPAALPEPILLSVARDLRTLERGGEDSTEEEGSLAAPMMLVLSLLLGGSRLGRTSHELQIRESDLFTSLRVYQWAVEREIVTRATGVSGGDDEATLLQRLDEIRHH